MARKQDSAKFKIKVAFGALSGEMTPGQIADRYGIRPNAVALWKRSFLERGPELFAQDNKVQQYERRLADLEQLLGEKEVDL